MASQMPLSIHIFDETNCKKNRLRFGDEAVFLRFAITYPHLLKERKGLRANKSEESKNACLNEHRSISPARHKWGLELSASTHPPPSHPRNKFGTARRRGKNKPPVRITGGNKKRAKTRNSASWFSFGTARRKEN